MELREVVCSTDRRWRIGLLNGPDMPNLTWIHAEGPQLDDAA